MLKILILYCRIGSLILKILVLYCRIGSLILKILILYCRIGSLILKILILYCRIGSLILKILILYCRIGSLILKILILYCRIGSLIVDHDIVATENSNGNIVAAVNDLVNGYGNLTIGNDSDVAALSASITNDENVTCRCITSTLSCSEGECDCCFTPRFGLWCLMPLNNISVISWWSVLLVEETGVPQKTTDLSQVADKLYVVSSTPPYERGSNSQH
jgi:hypothetical protein